MSGNGRYRVLTSEKGSDGKTYYTQVGMAFPMKEKDGFSIKLRALPVNGGLVLFPDDGERGQGGNRGGGQGGDGRGRGRDDDERMGRNLNDDEIPF